MERSSRGVHGGRLSHDRYHHGVHCIGGMDDVAATDGLHVDGHVCRQDLRYRLVNHHS